MSQSLHLYQLQKLDSQLDQIDQRLRAIQAAIEKDERLAAGKEALEAQRTALNEAQRDLKRAEHEVEARRIKLEQSEANLYSGKVKNPKELQDLQAEVASIRKALANLEDQQLEAMLAVEQRQADFAQSENAYHAIEAAVLEDQAALTGEKNQLLASRSRALMEREASQKQVEPAWLDKYQDLRGKKRGVAIAAVVDSACSACGTTLTPAECQVARSQDSIYQCPTCGRILYAG